MVIIGLSGTNGSGKDTVARLIVEKVNFKYISLSQILRNKAQELNLSDTRENLRAISSELRLKFGYGVLVEEAIKIYNQSNDHYNGLVVGSIRNSTESDIIKKYHGYIWWIDADPKIRYQRIQDNLLARNNRASDKISFEEFILDEKKEMKINKDNKTLDMEDVKKRADLIINNNYDLNKLNNQIIRSLNELFLDVV